ncbi:GTPase activating protein (GAP) for Rho1p [Elasticomyces elasticus]|uniref:GTPase activating protein (GAP) for Rho1p n=1 Tax=Exophiala sideris TaxID=1016849 RepID=A0ABR0JSC6_9EURO|nr:GTPase activating protein (GAP) for Rho1p [Elasticomyces elasticus]KAK5040341.1 GTPase activating protein (GAP) for Rho1p [Exophiala sideris]KAK5043233.1 GTPase activating protein (GAP) for Rho1p [Exophiala sideris]KAK5068719.1 GTPase activating protein (GAP) for Rho1p [Exophiala sideris]KAK5186317.1 GTPase activating protein (GAP) for Rho1p [Eurotiomycetes sp. CCFEE 6388]
MATGGAGQPPNSPPQNINQSGHRGGGAAPSPSPATAASPPSKRELTSWWKKFRKTTEKTDEQVEHGPQGIFGVPLADSIRYANVAISLQNEHGESFIYGYVPIVVAKCGVFLKEKATDVEGIFRLSGSAKRIKDLQTVFNSPDRYGKGLDWTGYTVHDAANILRRYLNQLPEPIVPLDFYERFREPLRATRVPGPDGEMHPRDLSVSEHSAAVSAYQKLITELPPLNRQLLLYILDLLAVFASKSDLNRMNAANLAAIFQPGIISHPSHDMSPREYSFSQDVLIFLIENQDNFLIGMSGTAVDEKTQKDVESGAPSVRSPKAVGRSSSNASAGADSLRKYGVRRNVSVSSRGSRERSSPGVSSPGTPPGVASFTGGAGISRSNTVPSKRSPAIASGRFQQINNDSSPTISSPMSNSETPPAVDPEEPEPKSSQAASAVPEEGNSKAAPMTPPVPGPRSSSRPKKQQSQSAYDAATLPDQVPQMPQQALNQTSIAPAGPVPPRERKVTNLFPKSPIFGPSDPQGRQPKKLQKRQRIPGSVNDSAQSSLNDLHGEEQATFHTPLVSPDATSVGKIDPLDAPQGPAVTNTAATPVNETPNPKQFTNATSNHEEPAQAAGLRPPKSPAGSTHSRSSFTGSELENNDDGVPQPGKEKRRSRWRFSSSARKGEHSPLAPPPPIGQNAGARGSNSSLGSSRQPRKSFTGDSQQTQSAHDYQPYGSGQQSLVGHSSQESNEAPMEMEKKGLFGKWKAKMSQTREERQAEKERAKSPPGIRNENAASRSSLNAFTQEHFAARGRSFEKPRDEAPLSSVAEKPGTEEKPAAQAGQAEKPATGTGTGTGAGPA